MLEKYPTGGRDSFFFALVVAIVIVAIVVLKKWRKEKETCLQKFFWEWVGEKTLIQGALMLVTFIAFMFAVRVIGLSLWNFLFNEELNYNVTQVLDVVAYVLLVNLCLTLLRMSVGEIKEIASATFQSALIAVLIFLPRASGRDTVETFGQHGAAILMIGFAALLVSLAYIWKLVPARAAPKSVPKK